MRPKITTLVCVLLVLPGITAPPATGQQLVPTPAAQTLDLDELLEEASAGNPSLRAARLESEALALRGPQVSALPDPQVSIGYQPFPLFTARGSQRSQWRVDQAVPYPGKLALQGTIADLGAEVAGFEALTFEQDLFYQVKQAYYELYRIQQQQALIAAYQEQLNSFEENAATLYTVGTGMQQAILKSQLEGNTLIRMQIGLDERRRTAAETLARLLNRPASAGLTADVQVAPPTLPAFDEARLMEIALRTRPEVDALDAAARRADAQVALARKMFKPDFGFSVTYFDVSPADVPPTATGRDALALGAMIKVPLQRGRLRAQLEEAELRRNQVEARQEALHTSFQTQIADLVSQLRQQGQQLTLYREALLPQAQTTLQATLSSYTTGRTDFLDLLDAERMLFSLQTGYEDTLAQYLKATAALERALGIRSLTELDAF